ncbi:putative PEP-binding protein [Myxococcota bacterium]
MAVDAAKLGGQTPAIRRWATAGDQPKVEAAPKKVGHKEPTPIATELLEGPQGDTVGTSVVEEVERAYAQTCSRVPDTVTGIAGTALHEGAATGVWASDPETAMAVHQDGKEYVLCVTEITPENVDAALWASAIVVPQGRKTSRATLRALAALGKPTVALHPKDLTELSAGLEVTVDGTRGLVALGRVQIEEGEAGPELERAVAALKSRLGSRVTAEASTVQAISRSRTLGADAVRVDADALLMQTQVLDCLRQYLLAVEPGTKRRHLQVLTALVRREMAKLIEASTDLPITVALGTRAPHSFFPANPEQIAELAERYDMPEQVVRRQIGEYRAGNSKLGLRGARWAVADPQLFSALATAVFEAFVAHQEETGADSRSLRLLLPGVSFAGELEAAKETFEKARVEVEETFGTTVGVEYGAGIASARGALNTASISEQAAFIEYGLDELTETMFALSRDDAQRFLSQMVDQEIYSEDPFEKHDLEGLGTMIQVGQYLAGKEPNTFPATIRGPHAARARGQLTARRAGIEELVVEAEDSLRALISCAQQSTTLAKTNERTRKVLDILVEQSGKQEEAPQPTGEAELPEGTTPLELMRQLVTRVDQEELTAAEALCQVPPDLVDALGKPTIDPSAGLQPISAALGASPGCGVGRIALSADKAEEYRKAGEPYVLVVTEVYGDDVTAVRHADGLVSVRGGKTSHAAMVASNSDVPCVMDEGVRIDPHRKTAQIGNQEMSEGDWLSIDGTKGAIFPDRVPLIEPTDSTEFETLMSWADRFRELEVFANADTPEEVQTAFANGAAGIGLVRTEHMFFGDDRLGAFRAAILSDGREADKELAALEDIQTEDFCGMLEAAGEKKVAIRLMDAPLYEFLPHDAEEVAELASRMGLADDEVAQRIDDAQEIDSLMGLRGPRLAAVRPDFERMQVRAMARAFVQAKKECPGLHPLSITVPMITTGQEMKQTATRIRRIIEGMEQETGSAIPFELGAMIETPRAALAAGAIAEHCTYFSYGTNDLTQFTLAYGRNVAPQFVPQLIDAGALVADPTATLDAEGVGKMLLVAEALGRDTQPKLHNGLCGGHGSDPASVKTIHELGIDYVSVPPGQVARARVAAARAAVLANSQP